MVLVVAVVAVVAVVVVVAVGSTGSSRRWYVVVVRIVASVLISLSIVVVVNI